MSPEARPSFGMQSSAAAPTRLDESNKGHQLLKKMGWGGAGLGASEQGIAEPIKGGEIRDRNDMYRGKFHSLYHVPKWLNHIPLENPLFLGQISDFAIY